MKNIIIREVTTLDANRLLEIYNYYIINTAITYEIEPLSIEEFKDRIINIKKKYPYLCIEVDGIIYGYAYANVFKNRKAYDHCVEMTIYLDHTKEGMGYGKKLYLKLEEELKNMGYKNLYACIGYPIKEDKYLDYRSYLFHKHLGYELIGRFHKCGYKFDTWYDMIWMEKLIGEYN